jgi:hypothetical protein
MDNYRLTLVSLKNGVSILCTQSETRKHVVVSAKQKIVGVGNMQDNDKDANHFKEMPLFTSPMNIKHIEKRL